ncbi:MAG: HD-GYP domain-containing protein [Carboxydocellales bacterium]
MRAISVDNIKAGMKVGRTIFSANGKVLLTTGMILNERFIVRLRELGITSLYIANDEFGSITVDDVISEQTRREAISVTQEVMTKIKAGANLDTRKVNRIINDMIDEILNNQNLIVSLVDIRAMNDYTFGHSVNVAVLSLIMGMALGYDQLSLRNLAVGALLHDIGKTQIPEEENSINCLDLHNHPPQIQKHTTLGFDILRKLDGVSLISAHVALQHHERYNGEGYPRGLKGEEIHEFAQIVAIAEVYDAMTSDTPQRARYAPQYALEYIFLNSGNLFKPQLVKVFAGSVAFFPIGNLVLLNTGEKGVVIKVHKDMPTRPVVRVLMDSRSSRIDPPFEIDLSRHLTYFVAKNLGNQDI